MAKRRTKAQIAADQIIKGHLNELGEEIYKEAQRRTRVLTGSLKKSINYSVKPDTTLTFFQNYYGKFVSPIDKPTKSEKDALLIVIKDLLPEKVEVIKRDLTESILYPFRK